MAPPGDLIVVRFRLGGKKTVPDQEVHQNQAAIRLEGTRVVPKNSHDL
jgi:hypothetical protein